MPTYPGDISQGANSTDVDPTNWNALVDGINNLKNYLNEYAVYDVRAYGATGDGVTDDRSSINDSHTAATVSGGVLFFPQGTYKISSNLTIDADVILRFASGAKFSIDNTIVLTINGPIEAKPYQIFSGAGSVTLGRGLPREAVYAEWWGATRDGTTDDSGAIQKAVDALSVTSSKYAGRLIFLEGTYYIESTISIVKTVDFELNIIIQGQGAETIILAESGLAKILQIEGPAAANIRKFKIADIYFKQGDRAISTGNAAYFTVRDCFFWGQTEYSIYLNADTGIKIRDNQFFHTTAECIHANYLARGLIANNICGEDVSKGIVLYSHCHENTVVGNVVYSNGVGIHIRGSTDDDWRRNVIIGNAIDADNAGVYVEGGKHQSVIGNTIKGNATNTGILCSGQYCIFMANQISNFAIGIDDSSGTDNLIIGNDVSDTNTTAIVPDPTSTVLFNYGYDNRKAEAYRMAGGELVPYNAIRKPQNILTNGSMEATYSLGDGPFNTSSVNTTFTATTVADASAWDLSNIYTGTYAVASGGSKGMITVVDDVGDQLTVKSWDSGTPVNGETVSIYAARPSYWSDVGSDYIGRVTGRTGNYAVKVYGSTGPGAGVDGITQTPTVVNGRDYIVSFWHKNGACTLAVSNSSPAISTTTGTDTEWTYYEKKFQSTSTSVEVKLSAGTDFDIDEVSLIEDLQDVPGTTAGFAVSADDVVNLLTGTAPIEGIADGVQMYSADFAAGQACPHFLTENDVVVKLNQNVGSDGDPTFSDLTLTNTLKGTPDAITATSEGVAASITTLCTEVTTNGDSDLDNVTLAAGSDGQIKHIYCVVEGNAADTWKITPASMIGGTQITFAGVGEGCSLIYDSGAAGWIVIGNNGGTIS